MRGSNSWRGLGWPSVRSVGSLVLLHIASTGRECPRWCPHSRLPSGLVRLEELELLTHVLLYGLYKGLPWVPSPHGDVGADGILTGQLTSPRIGFLSLGTIDTSKWTILSSE